jgi:RNA polymerase sigma factor (TIGR02999 family)
MTRSKEAAKQEITELLAEWRRGDDTALDRLTPLVYAELLRLARSRMMRERGGHTLEPTALVNEAFLRLLGQRSVSWQNRAHFYAIAAKMMRRVLLDHARKRRARIRFPKELASSLNEAADYPRGDLDWVWLHDALNGLAALDSRQAEIAELRYFGGHSIEETAEVLGISPATVKREWATARLWLQRELRRSSSSAFEPKPSRAARSVQ